MPQKTLQDLDLHSSIINMETFGQILEMDDADDPEREFSRNIVYDFFDQAKMTLKRMEEARREENMDELYSLAHFLKGSAATLGLVQMVKSCDQIEQLGKDNEETDRKTASGGMIAIVDFHFTEVERVLIGFYREAEDS